MSDRARELRSHQTRAEAILWGRLRARRLAGLKFRRQKPLSRGLIADFCCIERRLIIEVDGAIHCTPEQQAYDAWRTRILEELGYRVVRFTNLEVQQQLDTVCEAIVQAAEDRP